MAEDRKSLRAQEAENWLNKLARENREDIERCIKESYTTLPAEPHHAHYAKTETSIYKTDSVTSLFAGMRANPQETYCVLNFASYYNPGGGFLRGAKAQEEDLCMRSALYPVLNAYREVWYRAHWCNRLKFYSDEFIYSKEVPFFNGDKVVYADVLTMAAVNFSDLKGDDVRKGGEVMLKRMNFAYSIPAAFGATCVILGAWGCGVFKNNPVAVAEGWKSISEQQHNYLNVVHAIPDVDTYDAFRRAYGFTGQKGSKSKVVPKKGGNRQPSNKSS